MNSQTQPPQRTQHYTACLVRLWQDGVGQPWRASVQPVPGGDMLRFANLNGLFAFLEAQTTTTPADAQINGDEGQSGK
jgi:hypothetical protein